MRSLIILAVASMLMPQARADVALDALRATLRIEGGGQSGTAFLVALPAENAAPGQVLLVTAAHSFEKMKGDACTASFRTADAGTSGPPTAGGDAFVRRDVRIAIRRGDAPLWTRHPDADLAVLAIEPPAGVDVAPFALEQIADGPAFARGEVAVGQSVWVACFPAKTEGNATGWPVLRRGTVATHPLTPIDRVPSFFVDYSHFGGDSGSAAVVERAGRPLVAGVVVAMQRQTDQVSLPFEEKKVHTPLGLAITVPADRILQTIDRWRQSRLQPVSPAGE